jgi:hypothetical protein
MKIHLSVAAAAAAAAAEREERLSTATTTQRMDESPPGRSKLSIKESFWLLDSDMVRKYFVPTSAQLLNAAQKSVFRRFVKCVLVCISMNCVFLMFIQSATGTFTIHHKSWRND